MSSWWEVFQLRRAEDSGSSSDESSWPGKMWDEMDSGLPEVLPSELLGWLTLRRCNLTSQQRLNILSSVGNSLRADDVERGLRGAEDELRLHEQDRGGKGKRNPRAPHRANFWIERDGEWGPLAMEDEEYFEDFENVHWVGRDIASVYNASATPSGASSSRGSTWSDTGWSRSSPGQEDGYWHQETDGGYTFWTLHSDGEYYHEDAAGTFWTWEGYQ